MKKLLFFIGFGLFLGATTLSAQNCSHAQKTGANSCAKSASTCSKPSDAALKAAAADASIETKVCETSGSVCFKRKAVDASTGAVSYTDLKYDEATASFVNLPAESSKAKACCAGKKTCCAAKKTTSTSQTTVTPNTGEAIKMSDNNKE
jgi:hypothetical protein